MRLRPQDISDLFSGECKPALAGFVDSIDLEYVYLDTFQRDRELVDVFRVIELLGDSKPNWSEAWKEALQKYRSTGDLTPKYMYRPGLPIRLRGHYAKVSNPWFERDYLKVLLCYLASYIHPGDSVSEFGCGTGHNLHTLHKWLGGTCRFQGFDKAKAACELVVESGFPCEQFDMVNPDFGVPAGNVVLTVGSMEQLGLEWAGFYDYLFQLKSRVVIHVEPFLEMYDPNVLMDYVAIKYHEGRGYLQKYLPHLEYQASLGKIEILAKQRTGCGSFYNEGYNFVVWRVK